MGYRDINKYVFTYEQPESESENIINNYALHLSEHSRLFFMTGNRFSLMICYAGVLVILLSLFS